MTAPKNKKIVL